MEGMNRKQTLVVVGLTSVVAACGSDPQSPLFAPDAVAPDAASEPDVRSGVDAGDSAVLDAPGAIDAGPAFQCAAGSLLCTTFEGVATPGAGWAQAFGQHGVNALDTSAFTSPSHSYVSSTFADGTLAKAVLSFTDTSSSYSTMSARFMVRIHQLGEPVAILQLSYVGFNTIDSVALLTDGFELYLVSGALNQPVYPIAMDTWTEVRVDLRPGLDVTVVVNGNFTKTFTPVLNSAFVPSHTYVLGVQSPGKGVDVVQFDDVLLRGLP